MSMPPASPGRPTHRLPWFRHGPRTPTRPRSVGVDQPIVRRPRRPDRPPVRPGGRLGRRYRCPGQTDGASRRQVPSPTIAASHAGRPARPSDKTPSHRDTGLLRPLLGRARGQGVVLQPSHSLSRRRIRQIARWSPGVALPQRRARSRYESALLRGRSASSPCGTIRRAGQPTRSARLQRMPTTPSRVTADRSVTRKSKRKIGFHIFERSA